MQFHSMDVNLEANEGELDLPEQSTVEQAIHAYLSMHGATLSPENLEKTLIMINKAVSPCEAILRHGDEVLVLRALDCG